MSSKDYNDDLISKGLKWLLSIIIIGSLLYGSFYTIEGGWTGVVLTFGSVKTVPSYSGLHFKIPLVQDVVKLRVQTLKYATDASAASKDLQTVSTKIAVNFHLSADRTPEIYRDTGLGYQDNVIQPAVQEVVKATTAEFTAEELITQRPAVKSQIDAKLKERLVSRGIMVEEISITNFDFSESFNKAIEEKVTAEQLKLKADRDLERIKVEAEQKIASAKAEAESLRLQRQEITEQLLRLRAIEKWDGKLPQATGGVIPFIELNK